MDNKQLFKKYYTRLVWESILKALICGFIAGFAVNFVIAFATWFVKDFNGLWLSIGVGVGVAAIGTVVFYFKLFRPTTKKVAARIDRLGLEERMITMLELEGDESYIAMRQREDAQAKLQSAGDKKVPFRVSLASVIAVAVLAVAGISMTAVSTISEAEEVLTPPIARAYYDVQTSVKTLNTEGDTEEDETLIGGYVYELRGNYAESEYAEEKIAQTVQEGDATVTIVASATIGYRFVRWEYETGEQGADPSKVDENVRETLVVTAVFAPVEYAQLAESGGGSSSGEDGEEGGGDASSPSPNDVPSPDDGNQGYDPGNGAGSGTGNNDTVIDGETPYQAVLEQYYQEAMKMLEENGEIPAELKKIIEKYYEMLK